MIFCGTQLLPGEQKPAAVPVPGAAPLTAFCFCGKKPGKTLVVTAGVHGCEYVGIQALRRLAQELDPETLSGSVVLLPLANPSAFYAGSKQVVPEDGLNLNRAFPGNPEGSLSARLAWALEAALYPAADFLLDLHGGDWNEALEPLVFVPAGGTPAVNQAAEKAAQGLAVPYQVPSQARNGLYSWAVQQNIPSLLLERGGRGAWSEGEVQDACRDVRALLQHLAILPGRVQPQIQRKLCRASYVEAEAPGFWQPVKSPGATISQGELLGKLETLTGSLLQEVRAQYDGVILYQTVALGVRKGESLLAYGQ